MSLRNLDPETMLTSASRFRVQNLFWQSYSLEAEIIIEKHALIDLNSSFCSIVELNLSTATGKVVASTE